MLADEAPAPTCAHLLACERCLALLMTHAAAIMNDAWDLRLVAR